MPSSAFPLVLFILPVVLVLVASNGTTTNTYFDVKEAELMVMISDAVYCGDWAHPKTGAGLRSITDWTCPACEAARQLDPSTGSLRSVQIFEDRVRQTFGLVGVSGGWAVPDSGSAAGSGTEQRIVVSFRGSVLPINFLDDVRGKLVPAKHGGHVHEGCYGSYQSLAAAMLKAVGALHAAYPSILRVMVTGHSLGATQSVYGAEDMAVTFPALQVHLYSFGTMRPGDARYAARLAALPNLRTTPVAHRADPVPQRGNGTQDRAAG